MAFRVQCPTSTYKPQELYIAVEQKIAGQDIAHHIRPHGYQDCTWEIWVSVRCSPKHEVFTCVSSSSSCSVHYTIMSTIAPRMVIVDDIDSRIQYNGPWFADVGSHDSLGDSGPPFRSTLHGTQTNASFEFVYHGTGFKVYGTNNGSAIQCFVDGFFIDGIDSGLTDTDNNRLFCTSDLRTISDGLNTLTVNVLVMTKQTFWLDQIVYLPSASVSLDQETIQVMNNDPQLQYGQGWSSGNTTTPGSILTFDFIGVSISWYGDTLIGHPSLATYSIDGQTPINFVVQGTGSWNQKLFESAQLPAGPHTLKVAYQGNSSSVPLSLQYLVVQNGTLSSTATSVSSHAPSTTTGNGVPSTSTPGKSSTTSTPLGTIVGGVIGGLTLIIFVILGLLLLRRRAAEKKVISSTPRPFDPEYTTLHPPSITPNYSLPVQQSTLAIRRPSLTPQPVSRPLPLPLLSKAERQAEALAASESQRRGNTLPATVPMQNNAARPPNVIVHEDSGIRMPSDTPATNEITDLPPSYTE